MPPRHGKSLLISVVWPVWEWVSKPEEQFLCVSYDDGLALDLARKARALLNSDWFLDNWGERFQLSHDQDAVGNFANNKMGHRISATVRGGVTGKGGSRIIIDDPHSTQRVESEAERATVAHWWGNTIKSRKNTPFAAMIVVMQRCHELDLTGIILAEEKDLWEIIDFQAITDLADRIPGVNYWFDSRQNSGLALWPAMYPLDVLLQYEKSMDSYAWAGQYMQRPVGRKGGMFDITEITTIEALPRGLSFVRAWDFAATEGGGDWSVGLLLGEDKEENLYIADVVRGQWADVYPHLKSTAKADGKGVPVVIPQDPAQAGKNQVNYIITKVLRGFDVRIQRPTGDKETRAGPIAAQVKARKVFILRAVWNAPFLAEVKMFPRSKKKDQVDAFADAFNELVENGGGVGAGGLTAADYQRIGVQIKSTTTPNAHDIGKRKAARCRGLKKVM